jgi:hypothetical protein
MLTYATRSALLLRPLIQSTRATARALSATPYLDRTQQGPVWPTLTKKPDEKTLEKDGKGVCAWLNSEKSKPADLDPQLAARVYDLYLPVYYWCKDVVEKNPTKPTVIFMSAPQGCGKTTICDALVERFAADGKQCAALSYDDFYLTHAEQNEVAKTHENNRLLELRGNGGTHDLQLFDDVLTCVEIKFYSAFVASSSTPSTRRLLDGVAVWVSPLDGASTAASSPRNDLVKNYRCTRHTG